MPFEQNGWHVRCDFLLFCNSFEIKLLINNTLWYEIKGIFRNYLVPWCIGSLYNILERKSCSSRSFMFFVSLSAKKSYHSLYTNDINILCLKNVFRAPMNAACLH